MMANKYIGEVDAPEFGDGFTIRLDMDGHARIESIEGTKPVEIGQALLDMQNGLALNSSHYVRSFLSVALRDRSGTVQAEIPALPGDISLDVISKKCLDAFILFRYGKDADTWVAENAAKANGAASTGAPQENPSKGTKA